MPRLFANEFPTYPHIYPCRSPLHFVRMIQMAVLLTTKPSQVSSCSKVITSQIVAVGMLVPIFCTIQVWRPRGSSYDNRRPNCPHKLTKTAGPLARGGSSLGRLELHARGTSAAVRSCSCALVAAAAVPLPGAGM